ncbi:complex I subunit 5 family protein [Nannocystis pusilla]|uniref:NADH:quinone oxidoreductase/Mrp antiporter transmembrane domain-containing protein n=1 Tax=Nannocystis pusilla TaxID=889268 RepID=A0ABS7U5K7_9BACT|nr:proton-conducting transporter membrane subunit [Nannocystis pusilla]MBZ5715671.1 hypothetical protein [Nannocystis pusilla]
MSVVLPLFGAVAAFLARARAGQRIGLLISLAVVLCSCGLALQLLEYGADRYGIGGWSAPLGIGLVADGLSAVMLFMTAVVGALTGLHATRYFAPRLSHDSAQAASQAHRRRYFWPLWLFMWAALNALYLSADLFNLYVTLELLGLSAVPLVALAGGPSLAAAMRYLLVSMLGSLAWLFGVALLYSAHGVLDLDRLSGILAPGPAVWAAIALMTGGMLLKTAVFPLHFWLPPAHASAPAPVSALLSAVVVKATFYLVVRLWAQVFPAALSFAAGQLLGYLGAAAILWGSVQALRQDRIKLLLAYSTVAQLGYLFLVFSLAMAPEAAADAWRAAVLFAVAHAFGKAALFLASGNLLLALGHDRIDGLHGVSARLPITMFAFGLAGVNLMGLPPSGSFIAKWWMLIAALRGGRWELVLVLVLGSLLAAAYVLRVLGPALMGPARGPRIAVPALMEWTALALALLSVLAGITVSTSLRLLEVGNPFSPAPGVPQ